MPRRRTAGAAPRRPGAPAEPGFRPIPVLRVDVDDEPSPLGAADADVVWVEAVRGDQVLGLVETRLDDGHLRPGTLDELARTAGEAPAVEVPDERLGRATVVVSTLFRRPDLLERTLASLEALEYPDFDVVVVDNRPGDPPPPPPLAAHARVRVVAERVPGLSAGRNRGIAASEGSFVAFTDDDAVVEPGWLRAFGARFAAEPAVDGLGGLVLPSELDTVAQLWFEEYYGGFSQSFHRSTVSVAAHDEADPLFPYAPGRFGAGCNMAFRRSALEALGGFDPTLGTGTPARGGEDLSMFITLLVTGHAIGFEPSAVVRHSHRRTEREFFHQVRTYGTGLAAMYTSLVVRRPSTVLELARRVPAGLALLTRPRDDRSPSTAASYPRRALGYQLCGMALGPFAYARSWAASRRALARAA